MKVDNVIGKMAEIVERRLELYKDDFYRWDMELIGEMGHGEFVWLLRPTGTDMMTEDGADLEFYRIFSNRSKWFYLVRIDEDGSGEVTQSRKRCDEFVAKAVRRAA